MKKFNIPLKLPTKPVQQSPVSQRVVILPSIFHDRFDVKNYSYYLDGAKRAIKSKIVFVACVRDIDTHTFFHNLGKINSLGTRFKDYHIIMVENDSGQQFKNDITSVRGNNRISLITQNFGYAKLGAGRDHRRVSIMSKLRNIYMKELEERFSDWSYVCVIDMDLTEWRLDGILNSIGQNNWDMLGANGIQIKRDGQGTTYYDTFALIESNGRAYSTQETKDVFALNTGSRPVMACFGGIGVYKMKSILAGRSYDLYQVNGNTCSEQCGIHLNMARAGRGMIKVNPNMVVVR